MDVMSSLTFTEFTRLTSDDQTPLMRQLVSLAEHEIKGLKEELQEVTEAYDSAGQEYEQLFDRVIQLESKLGRVADIAGGD